MNKKIYNITKNPETTPHKTTPLLLLPRMSRNGFAALSDDFIMPKTKGNKKMSEPPAAKKNISLRPHRADPAAKPLRTQKTIDEEGFTSMANRNGESKTVKLLKETCAAWMLRNRVRQPDSKSYEVGGCVLFYGSYDTVQTEEGPKIQNRSCLTVGAVVDVRPENGITVRVIHSDDDIEEGLEINIDEWEIHEVVADYASPALIASFKGTKPAGHVYSELIRNKHIRRYNNTLMNCSRWDKVNGKGACTYRCYLPNASHPLPPEIQIRATERYTFTIENGWSAAPVGNSAGLIVGENAHIIADLGTSVQVHKTKGTNFIMYMPRRWAVISEEDADLLFKLAIPTFIPFPIDDDTPFARRHNTQAGMSNEELSTSCPALAWYLTPQ